LRWIIIVVDNPQEVDHFEDFFEPFLKKAGYEGIYGKKTNKNDGLATFWKTDKYFLLYFHDIL
jgi:mRNA deadenylase 3'-5' endonuclease subunit Ccr4